MTSSRIFHWIGIASCILLIVACFMPWTHYANDPVIKDEAQRTFTGFYTYDNYYGKPGKFLSLIAIISLILKLLPKVWAKRVDIFLTAIAVAYAIRIYVEYTGSYMGIVPEKKLGIYLMIASIITMFLASLMPDMKLLEKKD